eukprot:1046815-Prorocentrum_minimum.AAC.8
MVVVASRRTGSRAARGDCRRRVESQLSQSPCLITSSEDELKSTNIIRSRKPLSAPTTPTALLHDRGTEWRINYSPGHPVITPSPVPPQNLRSGHSWGPDHPPLGPQILASNSKGTYRDPRSCRITSLMMPRVGGHQTTPLRIRDA